MDFMQKIEIEKLPDPITYHDKILLIGSCFTEHIGNALADMKFSVMQNPNGILFDPSSVCRSLVSYIQEREYSKEHLFQLNDVWHSWDHHSRYSGVNLPEAVEGINQSIKSAHSFLKTANWIIITLGSSFTYRLTNDAVQTNHMHAGDGVANCHRAPSQWFTKYMQSIDETITLLDNCYHQLMQFNPKLRVIFTVSPVRHLRDGVVQNNRSKARLIEAVHHMVGKFDRLYYFPAYELVIDVLRDYRFYDIDLAHPNYSATSFVLEKFIDNCIDTPSQNLMEEVKKIVIAKKHRALQPSTTAHRQFLRSHASKTQELMSNYPFLNLQAELDYFKTAEATL